MTRLLSHFGLQHPVSAPYPVVAHAAEHDKYLGHFVVRLARAGDATCQGLMCTRRKEQSEAGLRVALSVPADRQTLAADFGGPEGMLDALALLAKDPEAPRLHECCCCGTCYQYMY